MVYKKWNTGHGKIDHYHLGEEKIKKGNKKQGREKIMENSHKRDCRNSLSLAKSGTVGKNKNRKRAAEHFNNFLQFL
jgi:hypothetical protein